MTKTRWRVLLTNWIHLPGFYLAAYVTFIFYKIIGVGHAYSWRAVLLENVYALLPLFFFYGLPFIVGFYLIMFIMDAMSFWMNSPGRPKTMLIQWLVISIPAILSAFYFEYWLWLSLLISFYLTQRIRQRKIKAILVAN